MIIRRLYTTTGSNILVNSLIKNNCKDIFAYSGGANLAILDELNKKNVNIISNINEQCIGHSATGYSKSSKDIGVILSTSGPGVTNLITPVTDAYYDGVPLIVLTGQVSTHTMGTKAFQECPANELMKPITKKTFSIKNIKDIKSIVDYAFYLCKNKKPGPIHIDCPKNIMSEKIEIQDLDNITTNKNYMQDNIDNNINININKLKEVKRLLERCKKPLIIAGQGANNSSYLLKDFVYNTNIPITTTIHGMGVFDDTHELSLEMLGMHGNAAANYAVQEADLILAIGYRFCDRTTGNLNNYAKEAIKAGKENRGGIIHFNIDNTEFNRVVNSNINLEGDCKLYLTWLVDNIDLNKKISWLNYIKKLKDTNNFKYSLDYPKQIKTQSVIENFNYFAEDNNLKKYLYYDRCRKSSNDGSTILQMD